MKTKIKKLEETILELNQKTSELSEIVDFLMRNNRDDIAVYNSYARFEVFSYYAKFIRCGKICHVKIPLSHDDGVRFETLKNDLNKAIIKAALFNNVKVFYRYFSINKVQGIAYELDEEDLKLISENASDEVENNEQ